MTGNRPGPTRGRGCGASRYGWPFVAAGALALLASLDGSWGVALGQTGPVFLATPTPEETASPEPTAPRGGAPIFIFLTAGAATPGPTSVPAETPTAGSTPTPTSSVGTTPPAVAPTVGATATATATPTAVADSTPAPAGPPPSTAEPTASPAAMPLVFVAVCHTLEVGSTPFALLMVPEAELAGHLAHGDQLPVDGLCPGPAPAPDPRYFEVTGFRVADEFFTYFQRRGGGRAFGAPISRRFTLLGAEVQLFEQRAIVRSPGMSPGISPWPGEDAFPTVSLAGLAIPEMDWELLEGAREGAERGSDGWMAAFVEANVPDEALGLPVSLYSAYMDTVRYEEAYPECPSADGPARCPDLAAMTSVNVEVWGLPTSRPKAARFAEDDPEMVEAVCQRFERGVLCYEAGTGLTRGLELGSHLRAILTGWSLPPQAADQAAESRYLLQYDPSRPLAIARPEELPASDLTDAFEPEPEPAAGVGGS